MTPSPRPLAHHLARISLAFAIALGARPVRADSPSFLPYSTRTQSYSGYMTSIRGDIRTVGMSGATIGLGDTFIAAGDNPAGLAMTLKGIDTNFATNDVVDRHVQDPSSPVGYNNVGAAASLYPWGFSLGYTAPYREEQLDSRTASFPDDPTRLLVTTREFRLGAARLFARDRLAIGASISLMQAVREIEFRDHPQQNASSKSFNYNVTLGALWRLPGRKLVGLSFTPSARYEDANPDTPSHGVGSFFQPIEVPARFGIGMGWIPNRFFRLAGNVWGVGRTPNTALLKNDSIRVGTRITYQPRVGAAYVFMDFKELQGTLFGGSYLEMSRIEGSPHRLHATGGLEAKVWAIGTGVGFDTSAGYRNFLFSVGLDVVRLAEKLDLIPRLKRPPYGGFLPAPLARSEEGLTRGLSDDWNEEAEGIDPIEIMKGIPGRIEDQVQSISEKSAGELINDVGRPIITLPDYVNKEVKAMKKIQQSKPKPSINPRPAPSPSPESP